MDLRNVNERKEIRFGSVLCVQNEDRDQKVVPRFQSWVTGSEEVPLALEKGKSK